MGAIGIGISEIFQKLAGGIPTFNLDLALSTFTARMAKRTAPGPFAAAPIVQGALGNPSYGQKDRVTFSRGNLVAGNWYDNIDPHQGLSLIHI